MDEMREAHFIHNNPLETPNAEVICLYASFTKHIVSDVASRLNIGYK